MQIDEVGGCCPIAIHSLGFFAFLGRTVSLSQPVYEWPTDNDVGTFMKRKKITLAHLLICGIKDVIVYKVRLQ